MLTHNRGRMPLPLMKLTHSRALLLMVLVAFMWSIAGVVTRHLDAAKSFEVTFWRSFFTLLTLLVLLPLLQGRALWTRMRHAGWALWVSGLCWSVMFTAFMLALTMTSVANVLVTMALGPLFTALVARVFIGRRLALRTWGAIVLAGCGMQPELLAVIEEYWNNEGTLPIPPPVF